MNRNTEASTDTVKYPFVENRFRVNAGKVLTTIFRLLNISRFVKSKEIKFLDGLVEKLL